MKAHGTLRVTGIVTALAVVLVLAQRVPDPAEPPARATPSYVADQAHVLRTQWDALVRSTQQAVRAGGADQDVEVSLTWRSRNSGYVYIVRSTAWDAAARVVRRPAPGLTAQAYVTVVDSTTGLVVRSLSGGNHVLTIRFVDHEGIGLRDTYAVTVKSSAGALLYSSSPTRLRGGDISVQA